MAKYNSRIQQLDWIGKKIKSDSIEAMKARGKMPAKTAYSWIPGSTFYQQTRMNGLRVYIKPANPSSLNDNNVFYSRRGSGPFYRWRYEDEFAHWRVLRMDRSDFTLRVLCPASWKSVPEKLQVQLGEHYLE